MKNILEDFSASIAVFLVALPLCLGIALASDAPLISGVIAGVVGGVLVGLLGGSSVSVAGPAAGLVVVVAGAVHELGSYKLFSFALLIAGILQIVFSLLGLYKFTKVIPQSVMKGMLSAIGILICIKEFPYLVGIQKNSVAPAFSFGGTRWAILFISISTLVAIHFWELLQARKKIVKRIPASLVGVAVGSIFGSLMVFFFPNSMSESDFVHLSRLLDDFTFYLPSVELLDLKILKIGFIIATIASLESLLCLEASLQLDYLKRPIFHRKELFAQGIGNFTSGLLGGLPVTAVIVRTAANVDAGARTRKATIFHGLLIGIFAIFLVDIVNLIPLSSLAVVLVLVGYKLFSPKIFIEKKKRGNMDFSVFLITIISILISDLLIGVTVGTVSFYAINAFLKRGKNVGN
jgi:MFS superfamily sulfate permease-like transporter